MTSDNRFVSIKFENFHLPMEARVYMVQIEDLKEDGAPITHTHYEVFFHAGIEGCKWHNQIAATFQDAFQLVADLSVSVRREFPAA